MKEKRNKEFNAFICNIAHLEIYLNKSCSIKQQKNGSESLMQFGKHLFLD